MAVFVQLNRHLQQTGVGRVSEVIDLSTEEVGSSRQQMTGGEEEAESEVGISTCRCSIFSKQHVFCCLTLAMLQAAVEEADQDMEEVDDEEVLR